MRFGDRAMKRMMYALNTSVKSKHVHAFVTRNSWKRLANLVRVELGMRLGRTQGFGFPYLLNVETTNVCNLRCPQCPTGQGRVGRPKQHLSPEAFRRILDEVGDYVYLLNLQNYGEPMLGRGLGEMIGEARRRRIYTALSTNGNYPSERNQELVDAGLDHAMFAIDGSTQELYEQYRVRGRLDVALGNIEDLLRRRAERRSRRPFLEIQFLVFPHNEHDLPNMRRLAERLGVDGLLVRAASGPGDAEIAPRFYNWEPRGFCRRPWYTAIVNSDGGIVPCCNYFDRRDDYGNVLEQGFSAAWDGDVYRRTRAAMTAHRLGDLDSVCRGCPVYRDEVAAAEGAAPPGAEWTEAARRSSARLDGAGAPRRDSR